MKMRKALTALLAAAMLFTTVPGTALAAAGDGTAEEQGELFLNKTATLTGDGSYTINMEAYATGKTTSQTIEKGVPLDIVLVLDRSGSMDKTKLNQLKAAAKNFVNKVYQDGQKHNIEHRIGIATFAGGDGSNEKEDKTYWYMNTGIYDENGTFVGYEEIKQENHYRLAQGELNTTGKYFVKDGTKYYPLTYNQTADNYVVVPNPATDRTDLFGVVNGQYLPASYGDYVVRTEVITPTENSGDIYYDELGDQLTWADVTVPGKDTYQKVKFIQWNQNKRYWIQYADNTYHPVQEEKNLLGFTVWEDDKNFTYTVEGNKFYWDVDIFKLFPYPAYELVKGQATKKRALVKNGTEYTGKVYTHVTETGWNVQGTPVSPVYELQKGVGKWQYTVNTGSNRGTHDLKPGQEVYEQYSASQCEKALVPVAMGANGSGEQRTTINDAIGGITAEGPTRIAKGVELANKIFQENPITPEENQAGRQRIMIVFTDGEPGWSEYDSEEASAAVAQTDITKENYSAKVYTIGLYKKEKTEQKTFMENMSSNTETDKKYYHKVSDAAALDKVFESIQQDITSSTTSVDVTDTSILRDIMSMEGFELTDKSNVVVYVLKSKKVTDTGITWEALDSKNPPKPVLTLTQPSESKTATGQYGGMTIKASTYMNNPDPNKNSLHTVDVTGFNYKDQYVAKSHPGSKLMVIITGVKALPSVTNDAAIYTNHEQSGIWTPVTATGKRELKAPFPEKPQTYMPSKSYVMDYAKPVTLELADFKLDTANNIDKDGYNPFEASALAITHTHGKVELNNNRVIYTPTTMKWNGCDTFYVFGTTKDPAVLAASANANGKAWAKVNVIPANNIYFEDSFVDTDKPGAENKDGVVGIYYSGHWDECKGTAPDQNKGSIGAEQQGWIPALDGETGDTDGSSHHATASKENVATATFTFTGTGVDVYSRTNGKTGTITAILYRGEGEGKTPIQAVTVDTLSKSGEYYQIPTLSLHEQPKKNDVGQTVTTTDPNRPEVNIPVMEPLTYGTYTLELLVSTKAKDRYEYYLDGIRIYNPMADDSIYVPEEQNATFIEVRDILLDASSFAAQGSTIANGPVFIDQLNNSDGKPGIQGNTYEIGVYQDLGPKNEVYLKPEQAISFKVDTTQGNIFALGMKSPNGKATKVYYTSENGNPRLQEINHTGDMFYKIGKDANDFVTIVNKGTELLAITKLKVTNPNNSVAVASVFANADAPTLLAATRTFTTETVAEDIDPDFGVNIEDIFHPNYDPAKIRQMIIDLWKQFVQQSGLKEKYEDAFVDVGFGKFPHIGDAWQNPWRKK